MKNNAKDQSQTNDIMSIFIEAFANNEAFSKIKKSEIKEASVFINSKIYDDFKKKKSLKLFKVGTLCPIVRNARQGVNPNTGNKIMIPASNRMKFKVSSMLIDSLNVDSKKKN